MRQILAAFLTAAVALAPARAWAERQVKPFFGGAFAGRTTFFDLDNAAGDAHLALGGSALVLGELVGVEADLGRVSAFFRSGDRHLVVAGSVTTLTGNLVLAMPRRLTQYSLRPYLVGGGGLVHARVKDSLEVLRVSSTLATIDLGAGATGFLSDRFGLDWQLRYFRSIGGDQRSQSFGPEQLSFWRATMALAFRY
ncbi:MAG: hypothetical protein IT176_06805 [Acidobacteria bacterium]|nr:hypothetical protein [Acidobacteriota bacterium]